MLIFRLTWYIKLGIPCLRFKKRKSKNHLLIVSLNFFLCLVTTAPHSSTLAWKNPMDGRAWWAAVHGVAKSQTQLSRLHFHFSLSCVGEGNGTPLQCSCLENPRGGGAWWAAVYGVAQSRKRLKRLSSTSSNNTSNPETTLKRTHLSTLLSFL